MMKLKTSYFSNKKKFQSKKKHCLQLVFDDDMDERGECIDIILFEDENEETGVFGTDYDKEDK